MGRHRIYQKGQENAINKQWLKELENASARFHITRLEALQLETRQTLEKLYDKYNQQAGTTLKKTYLDTYYHTIYEVNKGTTLGWDIAAVDEQKLKEVLKKPWTTDSKTFSDRIWSRKQDLVNEVHRTLTQNITLGKSPDKSIKALAEKMEVSRKQAGRLIMTESAAFSSHSQKEAFEELDVEAFEVLETLDGGTCKICGALDGKHFSMNDFVIGSTAPPFHPWCRGTTVPYFDDEWGKSGERAARGEDGKTYYVDSEMKYDEWKEKFVAKPAEMQYNIFRQIVDADYKNYSTTQNNALQNKHIEGSKNYDPTRGTLTINPQELYDLYSGEGTFIQTNAGKWAEKERFTHSADIGIYRSKRTGMECVTDCGIIHYSKKKGWHIVPARPQKGSVSK